MKKPELLLRFFLYFMLLVILTSGILYFFFNLNIYQFAPKQSICPFRFITGHKCPGCGMTKSMLLIGQLKFHRAFISNIFSIPLFLLILIFLFRREMPGFFSSKKIVYTALILAILYWITRNILKI